MRVCSKNLLALAASSAIALAFIRPAQAQLPGAVPPSPAPATQAADGKEQLIPLAVIINHAPAGQWILLSRDGQYYAPADALTEWRLKRPPQVHAITYRGHQWVRLGDLPGYAARFDSADQSLALTFAASAFDATRLETQSAARPEVTPVVPALFMNYDLSYQSRNFRDSTGDRQLGAMTELGVSGTPGVLTSSFVGQNITGSSPLQQRSWRRYETTFTRNFVDRRLTFHAGDSTTRRTFWGRPVLFGGLQIGTNFGMAPGFISQPIPILQGTSSAPSTVELYVNDVLRQTSRVPAGPFTIDNFPLLTSSGDARMVVRDALGRETVIDQPFFTHPSLLEQGLTDWSLETGAARRNLGILNADYGEHFTSGMLRHGFSKELTLETEGEFGSDTRDGGVGLSYVLPWRMLVQMAASASQDRIAGSGRNSMVGLYASTLRQTFSANLQHASMNYRQLAMGSVYVPYKLQLAGNYSYRLESEGSAIALAMARMETYNSINLTTYSGNYSMRVATNGALIFSLARVTGSSNGFTLGASLLIPLGGQTNLSSSMTRSDGQTQGYVSASKNLGNDSGIGWRTLAGNRSGQNYAEGGLYYQNDHGLLTSDVSTSLQQQTVRMGARGGMVMMDGHSFMTRQLQDSFALVEVPGYANVGITFQNVTYAHTDKDGIALLPRLLPYHRNNIRLNPDDLPISAEVDTIEETVVPPARSGVKVVFPVRGGRGALVHIVMEDGSDAPAGATVTITGDKEVFYVARRGLAYITGLGESDTLTLQQENGAACSFSIKLPPANPDDIPRIGPVTCKK